MKAATKSILGFILRSSLYALLGALPVLLFHIIVDPYKVVGKSDGFYPDYKVDNARIGMNKGVVTVNNYQARLEEGQSYNAFIFGSSISIYYDAAEWAELLTSGNDSIDYISPYHFDSASESLEQMAEKFIYLANHKAPLDYALIILDPLIMSGSTREDIMYISPPQFNTSPRHWMNFHYTFLKAATNIGFLRNWVPGKLFNHPYVLNKTPIFEPQPIVYDSIFNQESLPAWDLEIKQNPIEFYTRHPLIESPVTPSESERLLIGANVDALNTIANILHAGGTDYRIIIGPNRRKVVANREDVETLKHIFIPERVNDFSGSLVNELECDTLLYDNTHYRPVFASRLMHLVYN